MRRLFQDVVQADRRTVVRRPLDLTSGRGSRIDRPTPGPDPALPLGFSAGSSLRVTLAVAAFYAAVLVAATWPMATLMTTRLPARVDPVQHLTVMRWLKACLVEGRSPFVNLGLQAPVGAPLGNFSPMLLPTAAYVALSSVTSNDLLIYNLLWVGGFLVTGLGTFLLAARVVGDLPAATFAGLAALLSGPVMLHAHGHLELMYVGWFPIFLLAWMRLVDQPGWRPAILAAGAYGLIVLTTGYFAVLAVVPAGWYLVVEGIGSARRREQGWFLARVGPLVGFAVLALPVALIAFAGQVWNVAHGLGMARSRGEFDLYGVPWYGYVVPTALHPLQRLLGIEWFDRSGVSGVECGSYLGLAVLGLVAWAAVRRAGPLRPAFWWSLLALLVGLSFGSGLRVGSGRIPLPASWLFDHLALFRLLRAPARFNLFVAVVAAVVAASGLKALASRWRHPVTRWTLSGAFMALAFADLAMVPFGSQAVPSIPACYAAILARDPSATFLDAPSRESGVGHPLTAAAGYWQTFHEGQTTAGYSGLANVAFNDRIAFGHPFAANSIGQPSYLMNLDSSHFGIVAGVRPLDFAWLFLHRNGLRYVVLHCDPDLVDEPPAHLDRLEALLASARIARDARTAVFARDRLPTPTRPVLIPANGWRGARSGRAVLVADRSAELDAYNPDPASDLTLTLNARAFRSTRTVHLRSGDRNLANWRVDPDAPATYTSPNFRLPAGRQTLTLESDGDEIPRHPFDLVANGDARPYSLRVFEITLRPAP